MEQVILVDTKDNAIGQMEKLEAHKKGALHRAFSVLIFNDKGEMLLQKRAESKYHSGGLWTNACCSHPRPDEDTAQAAKRRLQEEIGLDITPRFVYKFIYKTDFNNDLIEHELDYVFIGEHNGAPNINKDEVSDWKYMAINDLKKDITAHPEQYTVWFKIIVENIDKHLTLTA
ncbi:MAG: isopentenyl-diphosphate Delta-isomerase [Fulvivirga sp.]